MENKSPFKIYILGLITIMTIIYLAVCFVIWDANPRTWGFDVRSLYALLVGATFVVYTVEYGRQINKNEN